MPIEDIRRALDDVPLFWDTLNLSFDALGFDQDYLDGLEPIPRVGRPKYVKDKLWGMMAFSPDELAIVDSPLLQRLRRIGQLGLTFLTYPSAEHSRFVHTLGVAHVVKRLIGSISEVAVRDSVLRAGAEEYPLFNPNSDPSLAACLQHAAFLHDVGHFAFSHAGESAFMALAGDAVVGQLPLEDFIGIFREAGFESSLSECMSIAVCLSPRFKDFYVQVTGEADVSRRLGHVCSFIGGVPHNPAYPGLANLISGAAVDADKIDYLNRDAEECGIPVGVDVSRVFLNSALVRVDERQATALTRSRGRHMESRRFSPGTHFIVNSSGIDTYDELANAKSVLYQRVYLHQLTRNAEQVLAEALHIAMRQTRTGDVRDPMDVLTWFDFGDDELLARLRRDPGAKRVAMRLVRRDLPKRAFALFRDVCEPFLDLHDIFEPTEWGGAYGPGRLAEVETLYYRRTAWRLFDLVVPLDPADRPRRLSELRHSIRLEAVAARRLLDRSFGPEDMGGDEPYVGFSPRFALKPINEVLVREKNSIGHSGQWTKSEELSNADNIGRGVDYVHADREWRRYVAVACVKVLYALNSDDRPATVPDGTEVEGEGTPAELAIRPRLFLRLRDICSRIGLDYAELLTDLTEAAEKGYFGAADRVVPLKQVDERECERVADLLASFSGERGWRVTERSVNAFVRQFPVGLRREILGVLGRVTVINRGSMREAMDRLAADFGRELGQGLLFCRFSPNSGGFTGMILEQERKGDYERMGHGFVRSVAELEDRLATATPSCTVFVDDQFATGGQAQAQLLHWAGVQRAEWPKELQSERNIDMAALGPLARTAFQTGRVRLAFLFGTEDGKRRIEEAARDLGFNGVEVRFNAEIPTVPVPMSDDLRGYLVEVGYELLKPLRHSDQHGGMTPLSDEDEHALRRDALGYGGTCTVMVTPFSTPSHAITALWCPGTFRGQPWIPLVLRRGYRRALVLG